MFEVMLGVLLLVFIWLCLGVIAGGYSFACFNGEAPSSASCGYEEDRRYAWCDYEEDRRYAYSMIPFGLIAFCAIVLFMWRFSINVKPDYSYLLHTWHTSGRK